MPSTSNRTVLWVVVALAVAGCDARGCYTPLPKQHPMDGTVEHLKAAPARPIQREKGTLICTMQTSNPDWDFAIPFTGGGYADLEARIKVDGERWRTDQEHDSLNALQIEDVTITPGDTLTLALYDIDAYLHDEIGVFELSLDGTWPLSYGNEDVSGACYFRTPAEAKAASRALERALLDDLKKAEATFTPELESDYFNYSKADFSTLNQRAQELASQTSGKDAKRLTQLIPKAEKRWNKRAQKTIAAALKPLPPLGTPVRLGPLEVISKAAQCDNTKEVAQEFGLSGETWNAVWLNDEHTCIVVLTGRNATEATATLSIPLANSDNPSAAFTLDNTPHPLMARATSGHPTNVQVVAVLDDAGPHPATINAPETWASGHYTGSLNPGQSAYLLVTVRNLPRGTRKDGKGSPTALMRSGKTTWRTAPTP